jgi:glyoxylase-like metal-dependent hydrolase (beta-lactamase superfamily II)
MVRAILSHDETVVHQIEEFGFKRDDVRHIIITHLDMDHAGGLSDFPVARVHVTSAEALGAIRAPSRRERVRYRSMQWAHGPNIVEHDPQGEKWRGFAAAKELAEISPGIALVSLPGHTRGHACAAVDAGHRWVLHAGDAFYHYCTLDGTPVPRALTAMESLFAFDRKKVQDNHSRLVELYQRRDADLLIVCAHDPTLLEHARATTYTPATSCRLGVADRHCREHVARHRAVHWGCNGPECPAPPTVQIQQSRQLDAAR